MAKITAPAQKKAAEQDELKSLVDKGLSYVHEKPREVAIAVSAVAGAAILLFVASFLMERSENKRVAAVTEAIAAYHDGATDATADAASVREKLENVAREHEDTEIGVQALYFLGGALAREGRYEEAAEVYLDVYGRSGPGGTLAAAAKMGAAYALAVAGDRERAVGYFRELLEDQGQSVPRAQIRLEIARLLRSGGDSEGAAGELKKLLEESPEGPQAAEAEKLLTVIEGS
jgi:tetratricopeptide (TPR) repeat protein